MGQGQANNLGSAFFLFFITNLRIIFKKEEENGFMKMSQPERLRRPQKKESAMQTGMGPNAWYLSISIISGDG